MSLRHERGKAAFPPNSENLGGVQLILDEYRHMQERINDIRPSTVELAAAKRYKEDMSLAERLSRNRAARRAAHNPVSAEHVNNLYHMYRRIEESYTRTSRLKNPWDTTVYPVYLRRDSNPYQDMLKAEMEAMRPASAPAWARDRSRRHVPPGDQYAGWSVRESLGAAFPKSRYEEALRMADRATYKKAMMAEILDKRIYKEAELKALFRAYARLAPLGDKETVAAVVRELKKELFVK
ncbi:hypothetical protein VOLCADRAFT_107640 [Volvox carteri f. nagariensis]|uniref:Uncharacterized protein n=1 Tax=Volvox carteri f. nagariensis TaxID=3068 RepID=D8UFC2_VOLCA|nr:uncharacterized protein VOLCADRAFT_107640 [Volvox carteri f. nagariensis]EFJ41549.1 hypothetical protein VOLCADRAFT_107640 [Volvox carteri f. nagariensis]|eukprot:XP_002957340.1 hypothetical protein VOLCADRAFT_107640 [Volvox carteri f. nagariensis]